MSVSIVRHQPQKPNLDLVEVPLSAFYESFAGWSLKRPELGSEVANQGGRRFARLIRQVRRPNPRPASDEVPE